MKQIFVMFALLLGVCAANAQETDTVKYAAGNDLYRGRERNPGESHDRGLSGRNELLRYLRGRQFLFVQRQVRP